MINATAGKIHWNYFIALERDLETASRYVEFCTQNLDVYSIEFARLLFAAASEIDAIAKLLCEHFLPTAPRRNINEYRRVLLSALPGLPSARIVIPRYGLTLTPWDNWAGRTNPLWWQSYNRVKHERDAYFREATLKNAINALGALLILVFHHYSYALAPTGAGPLKAKETTRNLQPESTLLRFPIDHYYGHLIIS